MQIVDRQLEITRDLGAGIVRAVRAVMFDGKNSSAAISEVLRSQVRWSGRKRGDLSSTVYDLVRWWRLLWSALDRDPSSEDRDLWHLLGAYIVYKGGDPPNMNEFKGFRPSRVSAGINKISKIRPVRESIPDWLDRRGGEEIGPRWNSVISSLNTPPPLAVRVNTLKTDPSVLRSRLRLGGHPTDLVEGVPDALIFNRGCNVFRLSEFQEGLYEMQDPSSQLVAPFMQVGPGMRVIDACAGEGGKTLHLSALMENRGQIIAMDDAHWKLKELERRASRAGAQNIRTIPIKGSKSFKRITGDRVLLDVPCSGTGALRRNPEIKWRLTPESLDRLRALQIEIIDRYSKMVKQGGYLIYATCSVLPSEGELQVRSFLDRNDEFELAEERRIWPDTDGFDGFYMVRICRK